MNSRNARIEAAREEAKAKARRMFPSISVASADLVIDLVADALVDADGPPKHEHSEPNRRGCCDSCGARLVAIPPQDLAGSSSAEPAQPWKKKDRPWSDYPLGTYAKDHTGSSWMRVERGWQASDGDLFPTPGADALTVRLPVQDEATTQEKPPQFVCGPTSGCGKSFDMVPTAENVFPPAWKFPATCPHCGQVQVSKIFIRRRPAALRSSRDRALHHSSVDLARADSRHGATLPALAQALDELVWDEDLDEDKLQEASEGLLPALADALHGRGPYRAETKCRFCRVTRGEHPERGFFISGNEPIVPGQVRIPARLYACEVCDAVAEADAK